MNLYNLLHGENPLADVLLAVLGLSKGQVPRYRDCYLEDDGTRIVIHTRTGGGNREDYEVENGALEDHPLHVRNVDDEFDCTYANFFFRVPEAFAAEITALAKETGPTVPPAEKWKTLLDKMEKGDESDPDVARALEVGKPIVEKILAAFEAPADPVEFTRWMDTTDPTQPTPKLRVLDEWVAGKIAGEPAAFVPVVESGKPVTAAMVNAGCFSAGIREVYCRECSICRHRLVYRISDDCAEIAFDATCLCGGPIEGRSRKLEKRSWEDAAQWINIQEDPAIARTIAARFGVEILAEKTDG